MRNGAQVIVLDVQFNYLYRHGETVVENSALVGMKGRKNEGQYIHHTHNARIKLTINLKKLNVKQDWVVLLSKFIVLLNSKIS